MLIIISTWNIILKIAASETKTDNIGMVIDKPFQC